MSRCGAPAPGRSKTVRIKLGKKVVRKRRTATTLVHHRWGQAKTVERKLVLTKGR